MRRVLSLAIVSGFVLVTVLLAIATPCQAQEKLQGEFTGQDLEFFESQVRPLLSDKCFECHGPGVDSPGGGLSLHSRAAMIGGGDTGPAISLGEPQQSLLISAINYGDLYQMPPDSKMSAAEIAVLTKWVKLGAPWTLEPDADVATKKEFDLLERKSSHWCWQPVNSPSVPAVKNSDWVHDEIDNFVLSRVEAAGLSPAEAADPRTLIRRVYFDLIGLPPTPEQVQQFSDNPSLEAYADVVDELLSSPRFGEHWARHWMDLIRYAESYGHEFDYPIAHAYQYRDYLIRAFNADVPYDQFVREHVAGDLLSEPRRHPEHQFNESVIGTGFWFLGEATHGPVDVRGDEAGRIDNQIDVMSKTFLGLTVACARCHDHKFDAIATEDYYALAGFLQSSRRQLAMLDVDRRIESAFTQTAGLVRSGDKIIRRLFEQIQDPDEVRLKKYVAAAIEYLRGDSNWGAVDIVHLQGERLKEISVSGGKTRVQALNPTNGFKWEGNKQRWWTDGKIGDSWKLQFELAGDVVPTTYKLTAEFTKANDYGSANILIDGEIVQENISFFEPKLGKTGPLDLGTVKFGHGKHEIELKLVDPDERAHPRNMIGLDWIELKRNRDKDQQAIATAAAKHDVDQALLIKFVEAIRSFQPGVLEVLDLLRECAKPDVALDNHFLKSNVVQALARQEAYQKWQNDSDLFADFDNGLPADWYRTGYAFNLGCSNQHIFSPVGGNVRAVGSVHSGISGANFFGVIRSPTFTLERPANSLPASR